MKARNKQTGEIVEILRYGEKGDYTVFRNGVGVEMNLPISFYDNFEVIGGGDAIDWEQRRYEIAKTILPYCTETTRTILMSGHGIGDEYAGKTIPEAVSEQAIQYADALIAELMKEKGAQDSAVCENKERGNDV